MSAVPPGDAYRELVADKVVTTIRRLERRIVLRLPGRNLSQVARTLAEVAGQVVGSASDARRRLRRLRVACVIASGIVVVITIVALGLALSSTLYAGPERAFEWLPLIESAINDVVFAGLAVAFLYLLPNRVERGWLLAQLHRLRSLAHIIDMHQLTKDPERLRPGFQATAESVDVDLDRTGMENYLDYCSEMLSLVGKVAALCAEKSQDAVVLGTVSTIETLTAQMSNKIWQKISLLPAPAEPTEVR